MGVGINTDYAGDSYKSPPSVGCYEYDSSVPSPDPATVTTTYTSRTSVTAEVGGEVTDIGGAAVSTRGVCYSTSSSPVYTDDYVTSGSGTGVFSCTLSWLTAGTTYYIRAYAYNGEYAYGAQESFTTPTSSLVVSGSAVYLKDGKTLEVQ